MTDIERVKEMVAEGRITAEEGDQLIRVLIEVDDANDAAIDAAYEAAMEAADQVETMAEQQSQGDGGQPVDHGAAAATSKDPFDSVVQAAMSTAAAAADMGREAGRAAKHAALHAAHTAAREARDTARAARNAAREAARGAREAARELRRGGVNDGGAPAEPRPGRAIAPANTKWVVVDMIAGDLDVHAVEGLSGPEVEGGPGNINVEDTAEGFAVKFVPDRGGAFDRFLSHVRSGELNIRIPADHGVVVKSTAGNVDLHGVRYLRGSLTAGDLTADAIEGIDFSAMAGDIDVAMVLRGGRHVLSVGAGEMNVRLDDRSDVKVDAVVSIGEANVGGNVGAEEFSHARRTVGTHMVGTLGSGAAQLELRATTGDINVTVGRLASGSRAARDEDGHV